MKRAEKIIRENANILAEEEYILSTIAQDYCIVDDKLIEEPTKCFGVVNLVIFRIV